MNMNRKRATPLVIPLVLVLCFFIKISLYQIEINIYTHATLLNLKKINRFLFEAVIFAVFSPQIK